MCTNLGMTMIDKPICQLSAIIVRMTYETYIAWTATLQTIPSGVKFS